MNKTVKRFFNRVLYRKVKLNEKNLKNIPQDVLEDDTIIRLEMKHNQLATLPKEIGNLKYLTHLDLQHNQLAALPPEIGNLKYLTHLDLEHNQLTALPAEIGNLTRLTILNLEHNQLAALPAEIGNLKYLTYLYLQHNQLAALPAEIGNLQDLTDLDLQHNQLAALPAEIGNLQDLTDLYLQHNQLTELPDEIGKLEKLTVLHLEHNQLTELPDEIGDLENLTDLDLEHNQLSELPEEIGNLDNLFDLNLQHNQLTELPNLSRLTNLDVINLLNNPRLTREIIRNANIYNEVSVIHEITNVNADFRQVDANEIHKYINGVNVKSIIVILKNILETNYHWRFNKIDKEMQKKFIFDALTAMKRKVKFSEEEEERMQMVVNKFHAIKGIKISYFSAITIDMAFYSLLYVVMQNPVVMEKNDDKNKINPFQSLYISNLLKDCITAYNDDISCTGGIFEQILSALKEPLLLFLKDKPEEYQRIINSFNKDTKPLIKEYVFDWLKSEGKLKKIKKVDENGIELRDASGNTITLLVENDLRSDFLKKYTGTEKQKEKYKTNLLQSFTNYIETKMDVNEETEKVIAEVFEEEYKTLFADGVIDADDPNSFGYNGGKRRKTRKRQQQRKTKRRYRKTKRQHRKTTK